MKTLLLVVGLLCVDAYAVKSVRISFVKPPTDDSPFGDAFHFKYEEATRTAWVAESRYSYGFRWSKREKLSDDTAKKIDEAIAALKLDDPGKPTSGTDPFLVVIDGKKIDWKGYFQAEDAGRSGRVTRFLESLVDAKNTSPIAFLPFDGAVTMALDCKSLTTKSIKVTAKNGGIASTRIKPLAGHLATYWGFAPLAKGDAAMTHEVGAGSSVTVTWDFDLASFKKSSVRTQLLYSANGLFETNLPEEMSPQYVGILRCDLPSQLAKLPAAFDEKSPATSLKSIEGVWTYTDPNAGPFHLVVKDSKVTFLGSENMGEHGVVYFVTEAASVKGNVAKQLRFDVDHADYYAKAFTPTRLAPAAGEKSIGAGRLDLHFEGSVSDKALLLRCLPKQSGECQAPFMTFTRGKS